MRLHRFLIGQTEVLLSDVLKFDNLAKVITSKFFYAHPKLGRVDRSLISEAIFAVLRRKMEYEYLAERGSGTLARRLALLGLMQVAGLNALRLHVSQQELIWLNYVSKIDPTSLPTRVRTNLPLWIESIVRQRLATIVAKPNAVEQELLQLTSSLNHPAPLDLRVNSIRAHRNEVLTALTRSYVRAEPTPYAPLGIRVLGKPAVHMMPAFQQGWFEVQDEGSQLLCELVAPQHGEMVVDFCAGVGNKTLALGAMMRSSGRLYAFDVSEKRLDQIKCKIARSGLSNVHLVAIDSEHDIKIKRLAGKIDRALVNAPCSGLGTLRRNPDLKWRQTPQVVSELAVKQISILASAAQLLRLGGRLVYATCSFLGDENESIVEQFIAADPKFKRIAVSQVLVDQKIALNTGDNLTLWPHQHGTDGFFAAVMQRVF
ncbi:RsmB/NOP family class I SAM-dependent RNA methyltransferase [Candidatus Vallotiella sp. (ex Adelges kitamiensis)]|uniref:RsmB/NOP family class I SAM-dependent RNA methyltransferase n=1 Tax=Candidatus Vallotiella sp. (ex Adelges kitamiensis) TaxID=2864217 RepID=UPI001CE36393|nr:RsmB/NOP family class I SAM-dependent RNA methyltransferase [Candidatus Vallotia sp. (ex Adelges kitamiensis)]